MLKDGIDIGRLVAALEETAKTLRADAAAPAGALHTITLKEAAHVAGVSEPQMRRRCEENKYFAHPAGYGLKRAGRWEVVFAPFIATVPVSALVK